MEPKPDEYVQHKALVLIERLLSEGRPEEEIVREAELLMGGRDDSVPETRALPISRRLAA